MLELGLEPEPIAVAAEAVAVAVAPLQRECLKIWTFSLRGSQMVRSGSSPRNSPGFQCCESGLCGFLLEYSGLPDSQKSCGWWS